MASSETKRWLKTCGWTWSCWHGTVTCCLQPDSDGPQQDSANTFIVVFSVPLQQLSPQTKKKINLVGHDQCHYKTNPDHIISEWVQWLAGGVCSIKKSPNIVFPWHSFSPFICWLITLVPAECVEFQTKLICHLEKPTKTEFRCCRVGSGCCMVIGELWPEAKRPVPNRSSLLSRWTCSNKIHRVNVS